MRLKIQPTSFGDNKNTPGGRISHTKLLKFHQLFIKSPEKAKQYDTQTQQ